MDKGFFKGYYSNLWRNIYYVTLLHKISRGRKEEQWNPSSILEYRCDGRVEVAVLVRYPRVYGGQGREVTGTLSKPLNLEVRTDVTAKKASAAHRCATSLLNWLILSLKIREKSHSQNKLNLILLSSKKIDDISRRGKEGWRVGGEWGGGEEEGVQLFLCLTLVPMGMKLQLFHKKKNAASERGNFETSIKTCRRSCLWVFKDWGKTSSIEMPRIWN